MNRKITFKLGCFSHKSLDFTGPNRKEKCEKYEYYMDEVLRIAGNDFTSVTWDTLAGRRGSERHDIPEMTKTL